jgi:hypothetical protein
MLVLHTARQQLRAFLPPLLLPLLLPSLGAWGQWE